MKNIFSLLALLAFLASSAFAQENQSASAPENPLAIECLGAEMDGAQTIKVWGTGQNEEEAVADAKKNAVRAVLLTGIKKGHEDCSLRPVVSEVNAEQKHEAFFKSFFSDKGAWKDFVTLVDESAAAIPYKDDKASGKTVTFGVYVHVARPQIRARMIVDKIIKP